ncbi:MAG: glycosyltransferase [Elainella sp. Prado103]|jgi:glycosyltransferase involved in cell wall biosynthesis|nr:glycosyltransferase [Elainella sp. Prado103]
MVSTQAAPLVSILINNYNYGRFLEAAIDSALSQTYQPLEVIVVDDGSTDNSKSILDRYTDRIIAVAKPNGGQASAFNAGFQACQGEIICFLDADDLFTTEKVTQMVQAYQTHPDIGWCFHPLQYFQDGTDTLLSIYPPGPTEAPQRVDFRDDINLHAKIPTWGPATSGLTFRRSLLSRILPMPESITISSDYYLRYAAVSEQTGFFIPQPLGLLRVHGNNAWTLRSDKLSQKARVFLLTGYWLRRNFPALKRLSNKNFGMGLGLSWWVGDSNPDFEDKVVAPYLQALSWLEQTEVQLRAGYHWFKTVRQYRRWRMADQSRDLTR